MLISELHVSNFRSFGYESQMIETENLTALIGANSSGKTSLIMALLRLFGQNTDRTLIKQIFIFQRALTYLKSRKSIL